MTTGFEPVDNGVADRGLTTWLRHLMDLGEGELPPFDVMKNGHDAFASRPYNGADYGARTRHLHLGKVALYQMS